MAKSKPTASEIEALRKHLGQYKFDGQESPVPAKLAADERALIAIAELGVTDRLLNRLLLSCIQAVLNTQTFETRLADGEAMLRQKLPALHRSVKDMKEFVREISAPPSDLLSASIYVSSKEKDLYLRTLTAIEHLVDDRGKAIRQTFVRIGATRKNAKKKAAENAGIGWLAASIKKITNKSHVHQACVLAGILFGIPEVTEDRLRGAYRNLSDRNWRESS
jgi:hypothetical protein